MYFDQVSWVQLLHKFFDSMKNSHTGVRLFGFGRSFSIFLLFILYGSVGSMFPLCYFRCVGIDTRKFQWRLWTGQDILPAAHESRAVHASFSCLHHHSRPISSIADDPVNFIPRQDTKIDGIDC
ncbi:hypothetical protein M430DRAFT_28729 [Amorphotheca resinae ATCC 22711]|uniref:Uncharacterized protein n=1 Tax=Amorphotheca resinae ATCC 22711 TaxID=857342 RepID=A0A2T3B0T8_AMORE|nr:hypothetical protein M430DRAFT_28729 [Amorphotheca resinae ATCC 22711]PSS17017.1 hypothetical protein M430DRAFT_28729 [Amorphotheca resinae ATCC 22711]